MSGVDVCSAKWMSAGAKFVAIEGVEVEINELDQAGTPCAGGWNAQRAAGFTVSWHKWVGT